MVENAERVRSAEVLLEAGIAGCRAHDDPTAQIFLGLAETLYASTGDRFNAGVARQWLDTVRDPGVRAPGE